VTIVIFGHINLTYLLTYVHNYQYMY